MANAVSSRIKRLAGPVFSLIFFALAAGLLHREFAAYHFKDILHHLSQIPATDRWAAVLLTVLSYAAMTVYDALALRAIQHPLSYPKIALASFVGYAFSNNIGLSMIAGASVRYRLYSAWGLSVLEISQVVFFCTVSLWLGFLLLFGLLAVAMPMALPLALHLPFHSTHWLGAICLALIAAYCTVAGLRRKPITLRGEAIHWPRPGLIPWQAGIGVMDWSLAAAVLYLLVPPDGGGLSFPAFLGVFLLAQLAGLVSQVPGGLGVFESVFTVMLAPVVPAPQILGGLLAYRMIYYWLPLATAAVLLGGQELLRAGKRFKWAGVFFGRWIEPLVPQIFGMAAFLAGTILLLSGATPAIDARLAMLKRILPLPFVELSHFAASVVGMGLLLLGRGLQRRLDAAYVLALCFMLTGVVGSLAKGFDYEEALILLIVAATLAPCRRHFYRRASLFEDRLNPAWMAAVLVVLGGTIWLGINSQRPSVYSDRLWWQFAFSGHASRFMRASLGAALLLIFFALARLLRPAPPRPQLPDPAQIAAAWPIVQRARATDAHLALLGDKYFLFNRDRTAFIMYGVIGNSWIAMGDPVGPEDQYSELIWRLREAADRHGDRCVFYQISQPYLPQYIDMGLSLLKLGEEARVSLPDFSLEGPQHKTLRYTLRKLEREGCRFEIIPAAAVGDHLAALEAISDQWLAAKNTREKGFSLGFFCEPYLKYNPVAVVYQGAKIAAFANLWPGAAQEELSIDLMRYGAAAPPGVMDYLFLQIMRWGAHAGYRWFNLGMAPLSGLEEHALAPLWHKLGGFVFRHGDHFYNFQGLRQYKEKFDPVWQPKYLACPGGISIARTLAEVSLLIAGGRRDAHHV